MERETIKIAWVHNFSTEKNKPSGVFMYQLFKSFKPNDEFTMDLINVGKLTNPLYFLIKYFSCTKKLYKYDILHAQYGSGVGFLVSLFSNKKILSLRGSDWYKSPSSTWKGKIHIYLGNLLTHISIPKYNRIIVMSERMKSEVAKIFDKQNMIMIPDGINLEKFYQDKKSKNKRFRVLFSSVNDHNLIKRYDLAKQSFELFHKKYPDSEMIFMTGIPHDQVNAFINTCDVILLTSTHEGWPNIVKEGLACNVPFVSTDVSDLKMIAENTQSCFVCEDNPESIASNLEKVYSLKINENLRKFVIKFELNEMSLRLRKLYLDLMNDS